MKDKVIGFIGAGNMASSLIGGMIQDGYDADKIWVSNHNEEKCVWFKEHFSVHATIDNTELAAKCDVIVIAVKPHDVRKVCREIASIVNEQKPLVISLAAGIQVAQLSMWLETDLPIVRCMPNTPSLVGSGAAGLFANDIASEADREIAETIMRSVGLAIWVDIEKEIDIVTALSGSGPAYLFLIMESMQNAAMEMGLSKDNAALLTIQTTLGAAHLALQSDSDLAELRQKVTSKGGTTEAAIEVLETNNIREIINQALQAAERRALKLSKEMEKSSG